MTAPDVMSQIEGSEAAADKADTKQTARTLAEIMAKGIQERGEEGAGAENVEGTDVEGAGAEGAAGAAAEGEGVVSDGEGAAADDEQLSADELTEVETTLAQLGIDLGVSAAQLPEELKPAYNSMLEGVTQFAEATLEKQLEASDTIRRFAEFQEAVEKSPDRLLLGIALSHPQLIVDAAQLVAKMAEDPATKDLVTREVQTDIKSREINRREAALDERYRMAKANTVIAATKRAARAHGVDFGLAEKVVAMAVRANGNDLDPEDVDDIVAELKGTVKRPLPKKTMTAAAAAAAKKAPAPTPAATPAAPARKEGERKNSGGVFRNLVRDAVQRVAASQRASQ
jgi:hypothetical protein